MPDSDVVPRLPTRPDFEVRTAPGPLWSAGGDVAIRVELVGEATKAAVSGYRSSLLKLYMLAGTGALAGAGIAPHLSELAVEQLSAATVDGSAVTFRFRGCRVDERTTTVCLNMLAPDIAEFPVRRILLAPGDPAVRATRPVPPVEPDERLYPDRYADLPFPVRGPDRTSDEGAGGPGVGELADGGPDREPEVAVAITFRDPPARRQRNQVITELDLWLIGSLGGSYTARGSSPDAAAAVLGGTEDATWSERRLSFPVRLRCAVAALDALVNVCAAIHGTIAAVDGVALTAA